jgi:hypothetical protein
MADSSTIMRDAQRAVREKLIDRGASLKVIAAKSKIPYSTLLSYFPGNERDGTPKLPAELPSGALYRLCGALDADLLNLLLPDGFAIVQIPADADYEQVSAACRDFVNAKEESHHPESEEGRDIGPTERNNLGTKAATLRVVA